MESDGSAEPTHGAVEVVLYINPHSATSTRARRNLEAALQEYAPETFRLIVRDVSRDVEESEADHIVFTPTLIVRHTHNPCVLVGDLADRATVATMLGLGGMESAG
jgi:hypothetical protein